MQYPLLLPCVEDRIADERRKLAEAAAELERDDPRLNALIARYVREGRIVGAVDDEGNLTESGCVPEWN